MSDDPITTIIVDDEELARRGIELRLGAEKDFRIVAQCANGREALGAIEALQPELMFLDIQLPGWSGFDLLARLPQDLLPLVVFVTAFEQHAIRAFESSAVDYLLKPVDGTRFTQMLQSVRARRSSRRAAGQLVKLLDLFKELTRNAVVPQSRYPEIVPIRQGSETLRLPSSSIEWVDAAGDYMCIHAAGQTHVMRGTMKEMEELLDPALFQRVHRSTIVNLRRVRSMRSHTNGEYFLLLDSGHELKLSRSYRDKIDYFLRGATPARGDTRPP